MKPRIAWLAILLLSLAAVPTWAHSNWTYDNGPINGNTDAWTINFGYIVSDTFVAGGGSYDYVIGFSFGVWEFPGHGPCVLCGPIRDTMYSVQWSITSGENGGMLYGSGTATRSGGTLTDAFLSVNQYGYDMDRVTVTGLGIPVTPGTTYWLNLFNAARWGPFLRKPSPLVGLIAAHLDLAAERPNPAASSCSVLESSLWSESYGASRCKPCEKANRS